MIKYENLLEVKKINSETIQFYLGILKAHIHCFSDEKKEARELLEKLIEEGEERKDISTIFIESYFLLGNILDVNNEKDLLMSLKYAKRAKDFFTEAYGKFAVGGFEVELNYV